MFISFFSVCLQKKWTNILRDQNFQSQNIEYIGKLNIFIHTHKQLLSNWTKNQYQARCLQFQNTSTQNVLLLRRFFFSLLPHIGKTDSGCNVFSKVRGCLRLCESCINKYTIYWYREAFFFLFIHKNITTSNAPPIPYIPKRFRTRKRRFRMWNCFFLNRNRNRTRNIETFSHGQIWAK